MKSKTTTKRVVPMVKPMNPDMKSAGMKGFKYTVPGVTKKGKPYGMGKTGHKKMGA